MNHWNIFVWNSLDQRLYWLGRLQKVLTRLFFYQVTCFIRCQPWPEKHKPANPVEKARIEKSGGRVIFGRILGNLAGLQPLLSCPTLAVARSFGDIEFKYPHNKAD